MSTTTDVRDLSTVPRGTNAISLGLWLALVAAVLQFTSLGSDFYQLGENVRGAWLGIPHTSQLILLSAATTVTLAGFAAGGRSPVSGRTAGIIIGVVGLIASAQLIYRMAVPPFGGCLTFNCAFTPKKPETQLLLGIWIALGGNIGATLGGFWHAATGTAKRTSANFWRAEQQAGMTPWLGVAGISAVAAFVIGFTILPFYTVSKQQGAAETWTGWMAIPHTAGLVLLLMAGVVGLVVAAARNRSPISPAAVGATIAILGFAASARTLYRIVVSPFYSGPAAGVFQQGADINVAAYVGLAFLVLTMIAGVAHATQHREESRVGETTATPQGA